MAPIKRTKEEIIELLKKVLLDLYNEKFLNRWLESRERPISKIIQENGLQSNYSCAIIEVLRQKNYMETRNLGVAMQYKIDGEHIPDFDFVAQTIYQNYVDRAKRRREYDGYKEGTSCDLRQKQRYEKKNKAVGQTIITKSKEFRLLDKVYIIHYENIHEGVIVGMHLDAEKKVVYLVEINRMQDSYTPGNIEVNKVFCTIDGILLYLRKNIIKHQG